MNVILSVLQFPDKSIYRHLSKERLEKRDKLQKRLRRCLDAEQVRDWYVNLELPAVGRSRKQYSNERAREYAARVVPPLAAQFFEEGRWLTVYSMPETLHKFRLHGKRLRDAVELFEPCYNSHVSSLLSLIREIHRLLGDYNDLVTTRQMLADRGFSKSRNRLFCMLNARMAEKLDQFALLWQDGLANEKSQQRWCDYLAASK